MSDAFRESLRDPNGFTVSWELVPGRGAREKDQEAVIKAAEAAAKGGKLHALTITDNPGGTPAISPFYLGTEVKKLGIEPLVHFALKDKSRLMIETELYAMARADINDLLVITGDFPAGAFRGRSKPVFDLDPVQTIQLIKEMNAGLPVEGPKGMSALKATDFVVGAAVSPFKQTEAELFGQYIKLEKKIKAGADFLVTQLGYDIRKFHEVLQYLRAVGLNVPVIASLYVLSYPVGRSMNANQVPGCVVTDELLKQLEAEREAADKGKGARILRAAKMYAMLKGMGYKGVHIGGYNLKYDEVEQVIVKGEELVPNWQEYVREFAFPQPGGFYMFERDAATGLNTAEFAPRNQTPGRKTFHGTTMRLLHHAMFDPKAPLFGAMKSLAKAIDGKALERPFSRMEHLVKLATNDCMQCGDCALFDIAYICPMSQCPKNQRNGACGGSYNGWCEVYPNEKQCVWVRAYARLKAYNEEPQIDSYRLPPADWDLYQTSSWYNFYTGRDHSAAILGIPPVDKKKD